MPQQTKLRKRHRQPRNLPGGRAPAQAASSSSEESSDDVQTDRSGRSNRRTTRASSHREGPRLPAFTGKELWKVWLNRFEDVAEQRGWDDSEKLNELLPKLQGVAGEFVYGQLSRRTRQNFKELTQELNNRFRKVESSKAFGAQFSHRQQKASESVEEYAAELKRLYDKAHPDRDDVTRREDLLRKFLDGLLDDRARVQVEYVKDPHDIDGAVFEVVNYLETRKRTQTSDKRSRAARGTDGPAAPSEDSDEDGDRSARSVGRPKKDDGKGTKSPARSSSPESSCRKEVLQLKEEMTKMAELFKKQLEEMKAQPTKAPRRQQNNQQGNQPSNRGGQKRSNTSGGSNSGGRSFLCFRCGQEGHFAKECTVSFTGQMQVTPTVAPQAPQAADNSGQADPNAQGAAPAARN